MRRHPRHAVIARCAMQNFFLAMQFLTRLPTPAVADFHPERLARSAVWFPAVGLLVGGVVALAWWLGALVDPLLAGLLGVLAWVWVTGALHLDGLSDLADALGAAHRDRARFLEVLKDPHVGSFGVASMLLQLLAKFVLLALAAKLHVNLLALLLVPAWGRLGALWWSQSLPPLQPGLGERFAWRAGPAVIGFWLVLLLVLGGLHVALWLAPPALWVWRSFLQRRLGGMTGDCLGAGVELVESALLLALVVAAAPGWPAQVINL